jgi:hypothetical protein
MNRRNYSGEERRAAAILTLLFTFIALWIAFVTTGDELPSSDWRPLRWLLSLAATFLLVGMLFPAGLVMASAQEFKGGLGFRKQPSAALSIAALITIGALLGLVTTLRTVLWSGPAALRWAIVGLIVAGVLLGSGRALGCAMLGALVWGVLGVWSGAGRSLVDRVDLLFTGLLVGATLGAVGGTLWRVATRDREGL